MSQYNPDLSDPYPFLFSKAKKLDEEVDRLLTAEQAYMAEIRRLRRLFFRLKYFNDGRQQTHARGRNKYRYTYNDELKVLDCKVDRSERRQYNKQHCCPDVNEMRQYALDALAIKPEFLTKDDP